MRQFIVILIILILNSCKTYIDLNTNPNIASKSMNIKFYQTYNELDYFNPVNGSGDGYIFYNTHFTINLPKDIIYWMRSGNHFFYEYDSKQIIYIYNPFKNDDKNSGEWILEDVNDSYNNYNLEHYWMIERKYKENHLYKNHKNRVTKIYTDGKYQILLYNIKAENFDSFLSFAKTFKIKV